MPHVPCRYCGKVFASRDVGKLREFLAAHFNDEHADEIERIAAKLRPLID